jgi:hypothetical protein
MKKAKTVLLTLSSLVLCALSLYQYVRITKLNALLDSTEKSITKDKLTISEYENQLAPLHKYHTYLDKCEKTYKILMNLKNVSLPKGYRVFIHADNYADSLEFSKKTLLDKPYNTLGFKSSIGGVFEYGASTLEKDYTETFRHMNGVLYHIMKEIEFYLNTNGVPCQHYGSSNISGCVVGQMDMIGMTMLIRLTPHKGYVLRDDIMLYELKVKVIMHDSFRRSLEGDNATDLPIEWDF